MKSPLSQTGEHDAAEDVPPEDMDRLAQVPASQAFVINMCLRCWVKRWVRRVRTTWATVLIIGGLLLVGNAFIIRAVVKSVVQDAFMEVSEPIVRAAILKVLKEHKLISSASPSPAAGDSVATLLGGFE